MILLNDLFLSGAAWQHERSTLLTLGRFISIFELIDSQNSLKAKEDIDWWVDLLILELATPPDKKLKNIIDKLQGELNNNNNVPEVLYPVTYRKVAQYRLNNQRIHKVPIDEESIEIINNFVAKYK